MSKLTKADTRHCTCCGRALNPNRFVRLELDCDTGLYHALGTVPADRSQGEFEFGAACAKRMLRETLKACSEAA